MQVGRMVVHSWIVKSKSLKTMKPFQMFSQKLAVAWLQFRMIEFALYPSCEFQNPEFNGHGHDDCIIIEHVPSEVKKMRERDSQQQQTAEFHFARQIR